MSDLKLIAEAIINMHDYDISFKKAFGLAGKGGPRPKIIHKSNKCKLMSDGFIGNPWFLCLFLSKVNQGLQPKTEDLEKVANALLKMHRSGGKKVSFKKAFGVKEQTGSKELDITKLSFNDLIRSEKWIIYHDFQRFKKRYKDDKYSYSKPLELMEEKYSVSGRNLERIFSKVQKCVPLFLESIRINQRELWFFYFTNRKYIGEKITPREIEVISKKNKCDQKEVYLRLVSLYEEVVVHQKYTMILRGSFDYPARIKKRLILELKPIYELSKKGVGD